jgi:hypothetical protein
VRVRQHGFVAVMVAALVLIAVPAVTGTALVTLEETYQPFADHFNAAHGKVRFVAILSPTCDTCLHGARAIADEVLGHHPDADVDVSIVWLPMLNNDSEAAARKAARMFADGRVTQFYDPERFVGYLYRFDVFPDAAQRMAASIPDDHPFHESMAQRVEADRDRPEWDLYMWFDAQVRWKTDAPPPTRFIRQVAHWKEDGKTVSLMWLDNLSRAPVVGVLRDYMASITHEMLPHE